MCGREADDSAWYMESRDKEDVIGRTSAEVYVEYASMCAEAHRDPLPKKSFGRALCRAAELRSVPERRGDRVARVYRAARKRRTRPQPVPEDVEGMPYQIWCYMSLELVDEYMRAMRTFEGMTYEDVYPEYSKWCASFGHVPFPEARFKAVFGRAWRRAGGCTSVQFINGRAARVLHDPPETAPGPTPS